MCERVEQNNVLLSLFLPSPFFFHVHLFFLSVCIVVVVVIIVVEGGLLACYKVCLCLQHTKRIESRHTFCAVMVETDCQLSIRRGRARVGQRVVRD